MPHVNMKRLSKCTRWGLPSSASFMTKSLYYISQIQCGLGGNTSSTSAVFFQMLLAFCVLGTEWSQLLRPAFKMVPGRQWCTCSLGYMLIYWQSESPETSWESPRLCRWEIMDGMFWLLRCETRLFCSNGVECSLRAEPRRPCLVILPGGIYS